MFLNKNENNSNINLYSRTLVFIINYIIPNIYL